MISDNNILMITSGYCCIFFMHEDVTVCIYLAKYLQQCWINHCLQRIQQQRRENPLLNYCFTFFWEVKLCEILIFNLQCKLMKAELLICSMSITESIFEPSIDLGVALLSLSEAALCGPLKKQSALFIQLAVEKVRQHKEERTDQNSLHSQVQHRAEREQTFSPSMPFLSPPSLAAAVLLSVFSSALIAFAGVCPRVPSPLFTPLIFYFPHIFSGPLHLFSNTEHQRNAHWLSGASFHAYFCGNTMLSLTLLAQWWSWHVLQATNAAWICKQEVKALTC